SSLLMIRATAPRATRFMACPTRSAPNSRAWNRPVRATSFSPFPAAWRSCNDLPVKSCRRFHPAPIRRRPQNRMPQNSDAAMSEPLRPREPKQVEEAIAWALAHGKTLELLGHGSKRAIGRAGQWDGPFDRWGLVGIPPSDREELVISAKAGPPLADINAVVAQGRQQLAFEPMDYGPLLGGAPGAATIGGAIAANLSGP